MDSEYSKLSDEEKRKLISNAEAIFKIIENKICKEKPQLMMFVPVLKKEPVSTNIHLETDGKHLFYNPKVIINKYKSRCLNDVEAQYLHILVHGILGHFSLRNSANNTYICDLVMDFRADQFLKKIIDEKNINYRNKDIRFYLSQDEKNKYDKISEMDTKALYYKCINSHEDVLFLERIKNIKDNHEYWKPNNELEMLMDNRENPQNPEGTDVSWDSIRKVLGAEGEETIKNMLSDTEKTYGSVSGNVSKDISSDSQRSNHYKEILLDYFKEKELFTEREDTIDKAIYSYGLSLYEDVVLIEPEESTEMPSVSSIAIAIDTSGSCDGDILKKFLRETKGIISELIDYGHCKKIYMFQCDSEIQDEKCYSDIREIDLSGNPKMHGFGGTSFVPVFERLNKVKKDKNDIEDIELLIYLTDGYGKYPEKAPKYPVLFVMPKHSNKFIPDWIRRVEIDN